jgi:hypothetical protein
MLGTASHAFIPGYNKIYAGNWALYVKLILVIRVVKVSDSITKKAQAAPAT